MTHTRRTFLGGVASLAASSIAIRSAHAHTPALTAPGATPQATGGAAAKRGIKLGLDHFAIRGFNWKAPQLIDYAASQKLDGIFLSELNVLESRDEAYLKGLRAQAEKGGLTLYLGMSSICPTSGAFDAKAGTAVEQLKEGIRMAKIVGSPVIRCFLGRQEDRSTQGGIETHIKNTVDVCKAVRADALAAGIKIAIENHAGDMQAWELAGLVEAAGPDYVGVNIDPGNATWTLEDPVASLETLAPYVACTSIRDSAVWETDTGVIVEWVAMGDGNVDYKRWTDIFAEKVKNVPVFLETFAGLRRPFNYLSDPAFFKVWPKMRASDLARFLALAKRGKPREALPALPQGPERAAAEAARQKDTFERSVAFCRSGLGMGIRA
ncbi:MAG TPA: TIM barrel protein [Vicinamibacterales bacterium]|nr:TIM barrel protein [Vicinamibacterales bacterium]